jgi:hypothetical protein
MLLDWSDSGELAGAGLPDFAGSANMGLLEFSAGTSAVRGSAARRLTGGRGKQRLARWADSEGVSEYFEILASTVAWILETDRIRMDTHQRILRAAQPSVVICIDEISPLVEAVVPVARRRAIPTVNVQHGVVARTRLRSEFHFDRFCVFGEAYADMLTELGTQSGSIVVVGNPGLDNRPALELTEGPTPGEPDGHEGKHAFTLLFAAQHRNSLLSDWVLYATLKIFLEYISSHPECRGVLKLHPLGQGRELGYEVALSEFPSVQLDVTRSASLHALMTTADCIATYSSTVLLDAATVCTPAIVVNPFGSEDYIPVVSEGTALRATNVEEFADAVNSIREGAVVEQHAYREVVRRYFYELDGLAGSRAADVCDSIATAHARHIQSEGQVTPR